MAKLRCLLISLILLAFGLGIASWYLGSEEETDSRKVPLTEFHQDFHNKEIKELRVQPSFEGAIAFLTPEADGLRLTLPARDVKHIETGVIAPIKAQGDFQITAGYEIIKVDPENAGNGISFEIHLTTNSLTMETLGFTRFINRDGSGRYIFGRRTTNALGKRQDIPGFREISIPIVGGKSGQMRIERIGPVAVLSDAEVGSKEFRELFKVHLGSDDVFRFRVGINPNGASSFVDIRLLDIRIKGNLESTNPKQFMDRTSLVANEDTHAQKRTSLWLVAGLFATVMVIGGVCIAIRKARVNIKQNPSDSGQRLNLRRPAPRPG